MSHCGYVQLMQPAACSRSPDGRIRRWIGENHLSGDSVQSTRNVNGNLAVFGGRFGEGPGPLCPLPVGCATATHQHSSSQKTRLNDLSHDIKIWTDLSSILSQSTRLTDRQTDNQTDGQTDWQTKFSSLDRVCIPCSAVKTSNLVSSHPVRTLEVTQALFLCR